jgi:mRNA-degrading endonuclease RelE of RelBE toxin-antitoxin system
MFEIQFLAKALEDLAWFTKRLQVIILDKIEERLRHEPNVETRNRKRLRAGHVAEWEIRIDKARVFYDTDEESNIVIVVAIGYKERNQLYFQGEEYLA